MSESPEYETDPVRVIDYNSSYTAFDPTVHVVREEHDHEVVTACGLTLSTTSKTGNKGGWVADLGKTPTGDRCGNCPWDEVDGND